MIGATSTTTPSPATGSRTGRATGRAGAACCEQELRFKGIDRETTERALDDAGVDEQAGALEIARAKMRSYRGLDEATARRRLGAFLARRGYVYDVVKPTLEVLFGEAEEGEEQLDP